MPKYHIEDYLQSKDQFPDCKMSCLCLKLLINSV